MGQASPLPHKSPESDVIDFLESITPPERVAQAMTESEIQKWIAFQKESENKPALLIHHLNVDNEDLIDEFAENATAGDMFSSGEEYRDEIIEACSEAILWTSEDVLTMKKGILMDTLAVFQDARNNPVTMDEAWDWIQSNELFQFSFLDCCAALGHNPLNYRKALEYKLKKLGVLTVDENGKPRLNPVVQQPGGRKETKAVKEPEPLALF